MSDHIYEEAFIREALKGKGLVVDREGKLTNTEEATKVKIEDGRVADIGKALEEYDALIGEKEKLEFWSQFIWSKKVKTLGDKS
ncbi:CTP:Inositol-1-phosphate cytidylyltransferase / Phospho-di-inositol-1-phosphate synthase [Thermococcus sp. 2319x1]|nr:CTP:Inositol-1-phosphate cytidylyltransferase / Phospho-di-inositol-1-phosphate synthase [Thermococcus sp. 2319x1]